MPDNHRSPGSGPERIHRTQRSARQQDYQARDNADEVSGCKRAPQREAYRKALFEGPKVSLKGIFDRLPEPILKHLTVDDVCRQTLLLVDLLGKDNVVIV